MSSATTHCLPLVIIFFALMSNYVLTPVLPFVVTNCGGSEAAYGLLQSSFWLSACCWRRAPNFTPPGRSF